MQQSLEFTPWFNKCSLSIHDMPSTEGYTEMNMRPWQQTVCGDEKTVAKQCAKSYDRGTGTPWARRKEGSSCCLWSGSLEWESGQLHSHATSRRMNGTSTVNGSVELAVLRRGSPGLAWLESRMDVGRRAGEAGWSWT